MKKKYIKTLSIALLLAVPVFCCTDAMAWEYYRFPWANAGNYAPMSNPYGYMPGGTMLGGPGDAVYYSAINSGQANPIWNEAEIFEASGESWYDCMEGNYHWNLTITNPSNMNCTFPDADPNNMELRLYTMDGTRVDENTLVENNTNNKTLNKYHLEHGKHSMGFCGKSL